MIIKRNAYIFKYVVNYEYKLYALLLYPRISFLQFTSCNFFQVIIKYKLLIGKSEINFENSNFNNGICGIILFYRVTLIRFRV